MGKRCALEVMGGKVKDMIGEILHSDVIYPGGRIMRIDEYQKAYPKSYAIWNTYCRESISEEYIFVMDYEYGVSATVNAFYSIDFDKAVATYICSFDEKSKEGNLYHSPIRIENKLIFDQVSHIAGQSAIWKQIHGRMKGFLQNFCPGREKCLLRTGRW